MKEPETTAPICSSAATAGSGSEYPPRRNFLVRGAAIVLGGVVGLVPLVIGAFAALDPLRRKQESGGFIRITPLSALPADGIPRRFAVLADRTDAWNFYPQQTIGAVYLRRTGDQVEALNVICPHLGCPIRPVNLDLAAKRFECPCHNSAFELDGAIAYGPSPRPMDKLAIELRNNGGSKDVWVQFENFYPGIAEKKPKV